MSTSITGERRLRIQSKLDKGKSNDYDFDKMTSFGTEPIDPDKEVVNPEYRKLTYQIKKIREKIQRLQARFFPLIEQAIDETLDKLPSITVKQMEYKTMIDKLCENEDKLVEQRVQVRPRIKLGQMPDQ